MNDSNFTFRKSERLCSKKLIEALFQGGHSSVSAYPIRAVFMSMPKVEADDAAPSAKVTRPTQLLISVSKRHFKHAVDRNRVKRQIREAYRLNKHLLLNRLPEDEALAIAFLWLSDELFPSDVVQSKVQKLLQRIGEMATADSSNNKNSL